MEREREVERLTGGEEGTLYLWMAAKRSSVVRGRVGVTMSPGRTPLVAGASGESAGLGSNTSPEMERGCVQTGQS